MGGNFCFIFGRQQSLRLYSLSNISTNLSTYPADSDIDSTYFVTAFDAIFNAGPMLLDTAAKRQRTGYKNSFQRLVVVVISSTYHVLLKYD